MKVICVTARGQRHPLRHRGQLARDGGDHQLARVQLVDGAEPRLRLELAGEVIALERERGVDRLARRHHPHLEAPGRLQREHHRLGPRLHLVLQRGQPPGRDGAHREGPLAQSLELEAPVGVGESSRARGSAGAR